LVQLENLKTYPAVAAGLAKGDLKLHGWMYKMETGEVFAFDPASGQFIAVEDHIPVVPSPRLVDVAT
jgi:carbonic anhydrase